MFEEKNGKKKVNLLLFSTHVPVFSTDGINLCAEASSWPTLAAHICAYPCALSELADVFRRRFCTLLAK
jgi:hypothetical protein